jgi:hypothetical protein
VPQLSQALVADPNVRLILADIFEPKSPKSSTAITVKVDLTAKEVIDGLFKTEFGVPGTIYCLQGESLLTRTNAISSNSYFVDILRHPVSRLGR